MRGHGSRFATAVPWSGASRRLAIALVAVAAAGMAEDQGQVQWIGDWEEAFRLARTSGRPVMVCINSLDGERANETTARGIYRDSWFVPLSRRFVMVVVSTREHAKEGPCPRFGAVTCEQHLDCWKELRVNHGDRFLLPGTSNEMISPQHAWFRPDGTLLQRKEYFLDKAELMRRMRAVLAEVSGSSDGEDGAPGDADATLNARERAELERLRAAGDPESRRAALGNLLAGGKATVHAELVALLAETDRPELACALLHALGQAVIADARRCAERRLADREARVRSCAAVCVERLAHGDSVSPLLRHLRTEREAPVRRNLCRALGACGGPAGDRAAAKALLKAAEDDRDKTVRKHAVLALAGYAGEHAKLVRKPLERLASSTGSADVRRAAVFALAHVGDAGTTLGVLEKVLDEMKEDWECELARNAIARLRGEETALDRAIVWLFWEDRDDPARKDTGGDG